MPNFFYTAKSFDGSTQTGTQNAVDEHQLAQTLKNQGLVLITADSQEKATKGHWQFLLKSFGVSLSERIMMVKNMGVMFSTGLSLVKSFSILASQAKNKTLKSALEDIKDRVSRGENLSDALASYPKIFSELFCSMVRVGEESGTLENVFTILANQMGKEYELKSKIRNAMMYPAIIALVMLVVGGVVITFVLPSLNVFFTALNVDIPIYTRILLAAGNFLSTNWYLLFVVPLVVAGGIFFGLKTKQGKWLADTVSLRLPFVSPIVKKNNAAFFVRSLSSLIASGVSLVRGLEITSTTVSNYYFKQAITEAGKKIKKGEKLSGALAAYHDIFPFGVIEMIEVGEETGKTSDILKKLADFYEQEAVIAIEKLSVMIEPILIIILGLSVGFFAFSIIGPMYSSLKSINQ